MEKKILLPPLHSDPEDFLELERKLKRHFREKIYLPLMVELQLPRKLIQNAADNNPLFDALFSGRISFYRGTFSGRLSAEITKELRKIGAKFNRKEGTYKLHWSELPIDVKNVVAASEIAFTKKIEKIDRKLAEIVPEQLSKSFKSYEFFDKTLWKADKSFRKNVENVTDTPKLTSFQAKAISEGWSNNMDLWIRGWTEKEIKSLRANIQKSVMEGNRWGSLVETIQESYGVSQNKAKFLARQETRLMVETYRQARYEEAGLDEYIWRCVKRPHDSPPPAPHIPGNVRYAHAILDGTTQRMSQPPIATNPGEPIERANPGITYNCRCFMQIVARKRKEEPSN